MSPAANVNSRENKNGHFLLSSTRHAVARKNVRYYSLRELTIMAKLWLQCRATGTMVWRKKDLTDRVDRLDESLSVFPKIFASSILAKKVALTAPVVALSDTTLIAAVRNVQYGIDCTVDYVKTIDDVAEKSISLDRLRSRYEALVKNVAELRDKVLPTIDS